MHKEEKAEYVCVFGNEDFDIRLQGLSTEHLLDLLFGMVEESNRIAKACWDIHTEFIDPNDYEPTQIKIQTIDHELDKCLSTFTNFYKTFSERGGPFPWTSAYLELLGTHVNIDHHPVLRAPASLFSNFVRIANDYFQKSCDSSFEDRVHYQKIIKQSEDKIFRVIRNWSHLTDQLTRTDDLVFHGIGRTPAIYDTIPESILLFYHRFLRETVDFLIETGSLKQKCPHEYDFLLVPVQSQRPRISKMFSLSNYHEFLLENDSFCKERETCKECPNKPKCDRKYIWPDKQVYLVEFQTSLL